MDKVSSFVADALTEQNIIEKKDIDKCRYGLETFFSSALMIGGILAISAFVGNFIQTLLFFAAFIPLRIYAGGYHAETRVRCCFVTLCIYAAFTIVMKLLPVEMYRITVLIAVILSVMTVLIAAPVIHKNKSVNEREKEGYRKFAICVCIAEAMVILLLSAVFPKRTLFTALAFGQVSVSFSMIAAIIKNKKLMISEMFSVAGKEV